MNPQLLPATARDDVPAWQQTVVAFLAEKERRSGSHRTVEGYARMLWPFLTRVGSPDQVTMRAQIAAVLSAGDRPLTIDRARLERQMRELALEHASARLDDAGYLARMAHLRRELGVVGAQPARDLPRASRDGVARRPR